MLEACMAVAPYRNEEETAVTGRGDIIQLKKLTIEFRRTEANARRADGLLELRLEGSCAAQLDRKGVVSGKSVSVRVDLGGRRLIKHKSDRNRENSSEDIVVVEHADNKQTKTKIS